MKCANFLCHNHYSKESWKSNCILHDDVALCEERKRYNLWDRYISNCRVEWVKRKWKEMKDKYYGRDK